MPRPLTRTQILENRAFLKALRRTGNVRAAACELGIHRATLTKRRAKHPAFAADWDAALALAHATLQNPPRSRGGGSRTAADGGGVPHPTTPEPVTIRTRSGHLQLRRAQPDRLTRAAEQAFLAALSATANVRLSAAAAGFSHSAFYARRKRSPAFAREMRLALELGYDRIELALLESFLPESHADDAWRHNDPPPIPSMTPAQALQLLYLHQKEARLGGTPDPLRRRPGEPEEVMRMRLILMSEARDERAREDFRIAEAARRAAGEPWLFGPEIAEPPTLPALDQVTRLSKAKPDGAGVHDPDVALFGGWRLKDWEG